EGDRVGVGNLKKTAFRRDGAAFGNSKESSREVNAGRSLCGWCIGHNQEIRGSRTDKRVGSRERGSKADFSRAVGSEAHNDDLVRGAREDFAPVIDSVDGEGGERNGRVEVKGTAIAGRRSLEARVQE